MRIEHDAVADDRQLAGSHDPGGQKRQLEGDAVDHQRMACIMAALEADHDVGLLGEPVDDLALALVAPLGTDHDHIRHELPFPPRRNPTTNEAHRRGAAALTDSLAPRKATTGATAPVRCRAALSRRLS